MAKGTIDDELVFSMIRMGAADMTKMSVPLPCFLCGDQIDERPVRTIVVDAIDNSNNSYHAALGFHYRCYNSIVNGIKR